MYHEDQHGRKQGDHRTWYDHKKKRPCVFGTYVDGRMHGKFTEWDQEGNIYKICHIENNQLHGEYIAYWWGNSGILEHSFYYQEVDVTEEVRLLVKDIKHITPEEKLIIKLKFGFRCLGDEQ